MRDEIEVTAIVFPDEGQYTALCLEFDIAADGDTQEEALSELGRLTIAYLNYHQKQGMKDVSEVFRPVPITAIREIVTSHGRPSAHHPVSRKADFVSFIPAHA